MPEAKCYCCTKQARLYVNVTTLDGEVLEREPLCVNCSLKTNWAGGVVAIASAAKIVRSRDRQRSG